MKLHFSEALSVSWTLLLMLQLVFCQPLDSNESSETEEPATCPNKVVPFLVKTMQELHQSQFMPSIETYVEQTATRMKKEAEGKIHIQFCILKSFFFFKL